MKRQQFTLIELIVIIAILLILAGMIIPPHGGGREKARRISCASNLKQLGTTIFMYAGDYSDTFPDECTSNDITTLLNPGVKGLNLLIEYNYLSDTVIYTCPSTTDEVAEDGNTITTTTPPAGVDNLGSVGGIWRGTFTPDDKSKQTTYYKAGGQSFVSQPPAQRCALPPIVPDDWSIFPSVKGETQCKY